MMNAWTLEKQKTFLGKIFSEFLALRFWNLDEILGRILAAKIPRDLGRILATEIYESRRDLGKISVKILYGRLHYFP